jgi:hypothetical protein
MNPRSRECEPCEHVRAHLGFYVPWSFMIAGGIASTLSLSSTWNKGSAYLVAASLLWFLVAYLRRRLLRVSH